MDSSGIPDLPLAIRMKKREEVPYIEISQKIYNHKVDNDDGSKYNIHETGEQKSLS